MQESRKKKSLEFLRRPPVAPYPKSHSDYNALYFPKAARLRTGVRTVNELNVIKNEDALAREAYLDKR